MKHHKINTSNSFWVLLSISLILFCLPLVGYSQTEDVSTLIQKLKDKDANVRFKAARALGETKDICAVEPLIIALKDDDKNVRRISARALGKITNNKALEPLIVALNDEDEIVRSGAAEALGKVKDVHAVAPLINALKDKDKQVRTDAAWALGEIQDARAVESLIIVLKDEETIVRDIAIEALKKINNANVKAHTIKVSLIMHRCVRNEIKEDEYYTKGYVNMFLVPLIAKQGFIVEFVGEQKSPRNIEKGNLIIEYN